MNQLTVIKASSAAFWPTEGRVVQASDFETAQAVLADLARKILNWHRRRQAAAELRSLSDLELKDIGLCRSEVLSVVNTGTFQRKVHSHAHN